MIKLGSQDIFGQGYFETNEAVFGFDKPLLGL